MVDTVIAMGSGMPTVKLTVGDLKHADDIAPRWDKMETNQTEPKFSHELLAGLV